MRFSSLFPVVSVLLLAASVPASATPHVRRGPTAPRLFRGHTPKNVVKPSIARTSIAPERAAELQTALIKAGYLSGTPSGTWDAASQAAMEKLQADNGWQTKLVPDSRAIIKLGLGPNASSAPATLESSLPHVDAADDAPVHATNQ
jgi:hypothetical protein